MIKADQVRMHAREDIKIVTGGNREDINSQGEPVVLSGIHLIAGNKEGEQQPLVLGENLRLALMCIIEKLNQVNSQLQSFASQQIKVNKAFMDHNHVSNHAGAVCTISPTGARTAAEQIVKQFKGSGEGIYLDRSNITSLNKLFLGGEVTSGIHKKVSERKKQSKGEKSFYILSSYNTTN